MSPLGIALLIVALLIILILTIGTYFFFVYSIKRREPEKNPKYLSDPTNPWTVMKTKMDEGKAWINSHKLEKIQITSYDNLKLVGHFFPAENKSNKTILMMHGYRSQDFNDFCCSAKYFHDSGYNILLADQRCHGESEGKYICFGVKERYDCLEWIKYITHRYGDDSDIFLMGVSMGAATVLMTLGFDVPKTVKGCIADCGFTSPDAIFRHVVKRDFHLPAFPFVYLQALACKVFAGFGTKEYSTITALKNNQIPVLFIHGLKDDFVPTYMSKENFAACKGEKKLLLIPEAEHAMSFLREPEKCWSAMKKFIEKYS